MDSLLVGIAVIENGCWAIRSDERLHHVYWPAGTTLTGARMQAPGMKQPIESGQEVRASGGEVAASELASSAHECWGENDLVFSAWSVEKLE